jgi:hypothetical protein
LLDFFQDRNTKVSLFLNAGLQSSLDGSFIIDINDYVLGSEKPGTIKFYDSNGKVSKILQIENHPFKFYKKNEVNHFDLSLRTSSYGYNLYVDKKKDEERIKGSANKENSRPSVNTTDISSLTSDTKVAQDNFKIKTSKKKDITSNPLSKFIARSPENEKMTGKGVFKIENLFPDTKASQPEIESKPETYILQFDDSTSGSNDLQKLIDEFSSIDMKATLQESDDLLSLMDST